MHKIALVVLMFCKIVSKSSYHQSAESFGLTGSLRMIRRCRMVLDTKKSAELCEAFGHELRATIRKEVGRDVTRYDPMNEEDVRNMR